MTTADKIELYLAEGRFQPSTFEITFDESKHYLGATCKRGHAYEDTGKSVRGISHRNCMICMRLNSFVWIDTNRDRARATGRLYEATEIGKSKRKNAQDKWIAQPENKFRTLVHGASSRAKKLGIPCDITQEFMVELFNAQDGKCYWTGVPFINVGKARHPLKPSIDRIVPEAGYVKGNVVWASNFANRARSDTPATEFHEIVSTFSQHALRKRPPIWCHTN